MLEDKLLSKEVFEVHIKYTKEALNELKNTTALIFHKVDAHEKTLVRNTVSLEEHKKRSLHIEERQEVFMETLSKMSNDFSIVADSIRKINLKIDLIESELEPVKDHIRDVKNITNFFNVIYNNKKLIVKSLVFVFFIVSGLYYGILNVETIIRALK